MAATMMVHLISFNWVFARKMIKTAFLGLKSGFLTDFALKMAKSNKKRSKKVYFAQN
jgi:hypothetical protein